MNISSCMKKLSKKALLILLAAVMAVLAASCGFQGGSRGEGDTSRTDSAAAEGNGSDFTVTHTAEITVKDMGVIVVELYGKLAPVTVENFVKLADEKYFDGLTFHRAQPGFVIQGGASDKPCDTIKGEFSANGVKNDLSHTRGVISMARTNDPDSASSQFFIVLDDAAMSSLDGMYAGFGKVTKGMDVVDKIAQAPGNQANMGFIDNVADQPVIESIRIRK